MILQSLVECYETLEKQGKVPRFGWCFSKVSYAINIDIDGEIKGIICCKTENNIPKNMIVPEQQSTTSGTVPFFLCDTSKYILGINKKDDEKSKKECRKKFNSSKELHLNLLKNIDNDVAKAICNFYNKWNPEDARNNKIIDEYFDEIADGERLVFHVMTKYAQDDREIQNVWDEYLSQEDGVDGICLVTGKHGKIAKVHKKIKGVKGAKSSGAALVSFNVESFESHWKEQGYNAPVSRDAEFAYTTALNYLLSKQEHKMQVGDMTLVFWSESNQKECQDLFRFSINPSEDEDFDLVKIFNDVKQQKDININGIKIDLKQKFYILCLSPNVGRISIQSFYQNTFKDILLNLVCHQQRLEIIKPKYAKKDTLKTQDLIGATVNKKLKDPFKKVSYTATSLYEAIILGKNYPEKLYTDVLERIRAETGNVDYIRAAIIKAFLMKNKNWEGENFMSLNENCKEVSYLLGRLFSVLESIQLESMNKEYNANDVTTIKDRFFNSACTTPNLMFPKLLSLSNYHLKKLNRDKKGKAIYYNQILLSIMNNIDIDDGFPMTLSLEDKGKFILGYYHQTQKRFESKKENNETEKVEEL